MIWYIGIAGHAPRLIARSLTQAHAVARPGEVIIEAGAISNVIIHEDGLSVLPVIVSEETMA